MLPKKASAWFWTALILISTSWHTIPAHAQERLLLYGIFPQRGSAGAEVLLLLKGEGFFEFGRLMSVTLEGQEVPFSDYTVLSNEISTVRISIPEQAPIRETGLLFTFENFRVESFFVVMDRSQAAPFISGFAPRAGRQDSEATLFFDGRDFLELGAPGSLLIEEVEIPILEFRVEADDSMRVAVYLPGETPIGETRLAIFFENTSYDGPFLVNPREPIINQPPPPVLERLFPVEGQLDTELVLTLEGKGFLELGELLSVNIGGLEVPVLDYQIESENKLEIAIYLPNETPIGRQPITIFFDNAGLEGGGFTVLDREPEPVFPLLSAVTPREGLVDTEIELRLDGESLFDLGALISVNMTGFEVPVNYSEIDSAESMRIGITLPADTPHGERIISFVFENASFETPFRVIAPPSPGIPPEIVVAVGVAVVGLAGAGGWLALRARKSRADQLREKPGKHLPQIDFIVAIDPGTQSVEFAEQSLALDIDLRFELEVDQGDQEIEPDGTSIVSQE